MFITCIIGLGALLVHQRARHTLRKRYFGGGTVEMFSSSRDFHVPRKLLEETYNIAMCYYHREPG